jgi:putative tricarboxylic transport membrane protein
MGPLEGLAYGFSVALLPSNLFACFVGVLVGTIVGVLPGIGPVGAMALLLPSTFAMHPTTALIMLAGIYYGAMYGGSTTSILVNVPGEAGSVVTLLDGYQMTKKGRAGAALTIAAAGSFFAGTVGVVGISWRRAGSPTPPFGSAPRNTSRSRSEASCSSPACRAARSSMPS